MVDDTCRHDVTIVPPPAPACERFVAVFDVRWPRDIPPGAEGARDRIPPGRPSDRTRQGRHETVRGRNPVFFRLISP